MRFEWDAAKNQSYQKKHRRLEFEISQGDWPLRPQRKQPL